MSIKKEASGRRSVELAVEVPGTPEHMWEAIATGPSISAWFVPAKTEEEDGEPVAITLDFDPGQESRSIVKACEPAAAPGARRTRKEPGLLTGDRCPLPHRVRRHGDGNAHVLSLQ